MSPGDDLSGNQSASPLVPWNELSAPERQRWRQEITKISLPPLIFELQDVGDDPDEFEPAKAAALIAHDPLLGGKLLAVANSAAMGLSNPVTTLERAIITLGFNTVQAIVLAYHLEAVFGQWPDFPRRHFSFVRRVSATSALLASELAAAAGLGGAKLLGTAALLARLGSLILGLTQPRPDRGYREVPNEVLRAKYEMRKWGISTPVLSGQLIRHWGIPEPLPALVEQQCKPLFIKLEPGREERPLLMLATATVLAGAYVAAGKLAPHVQLDRSAYERLQENLRLHDLWHRTASLAGHVRLSRELEVLRE